MAVRLLVTVGSDGVTDWVRTPDGSRHNLGPVSVLRFVSKLSRDKRTARTALDAFLREGETMLNVDEGLMWEILVPRRARWASDGPFITRDQRTVPRRTRNRTMATFDNDLATIEQHLVQLDKAAELGTASPEHMAEGHAVLAKLAQKVAPHQKTAAYYGVGEGEDGNAVGVEPDAPMTVMAGEAVDGLAYDTYAVNTDLANTIITQGEETSAKIDALVASGQQFNATQARADLYAVSSKVAGLLQDVDLTTTWVQEDLQKLAARADHLHGLFATAKV